MRKRSRPIGRLLFGASQPSPPVLSRNWVSLASFRTRVALSGNRDTWEADLAAMAADPEMQRELKRINAEFAATEADGLEKH